MLEIRMLDSSIVWNNGARLIESDETKEKIARGPTGLDYACAEIPLDSFFEKAAFQMMSSALKVESVDDKNLRLQVSSEDVLKKWSQPLVLSIQPVEKFNSVSTTEHRLLKGEQLHVDLTGIRAEARSLVCTHVMALLQIPLLWSDLPHGMAVDVVRWMMGHLLMSKGIAIPLFHTSHRVNMGFVCHIPKDENRGNNIPLSSLYLSVEITKDSKRKPIERDPHSLLQKLKVNDEQNQNTLDTFRVEFNSHDGKKKTLEYLKTVRFERDIQKHFTLHRNMCLLDTECFMESLRILRELRMWEEMVTLIHEAYIQSTQSKEILKPLRMEQALLLTEELRQQNQAIEVLENIVDEDHTEREAWALLMELFEKRGDFKKLADVIERRLKSGGIQEFEQHQLKKRRIQALFELQDVRWMYEAKVWVEKNPQDVLFVRWIEQKTSNKN